MSTPMIAVKIAAKQDEPDRDVDPGRSRSDSGIAEEERVVRELRRGEPAGDVGAHRVEGDVAEVEQPGVADDDVQAERHHH